MSDNKERKPRKWAVFNPWTGHYVPFIGYKSKEDFRRDLRDEVLFKRMGLIITGLIVIVGLVWAVLSELLK